MKFRTASQDSKQGKCHKSVFSKDATDARVDFDRDHVNHNHVALMDFNHSRIGLLRL